MEFYDSPLASDQLWFRLAGSLAGLSIFLYAKAMLIASLWMLWVRRSKHLPENAPGVTILKPIHGLDDGLSENIASFLELDYARMQIIFCCENPHDPGMEVVRRVVRRYPNRDVMLLHQQGSDAASPKMANLTAMLPHAKHDLILLSDSNVRIQRDDLSRLVQPMGHPKVGLVYQPVTGIGEEKGSAFVENMRLTEFAGLLTIGAKLLFRQDIVMAKGMLCRRQALSDAGNFTRILNVAADDFLLAKYIKDAGWKLFLSDVPAYVVHQSWPWKLLYARHIRHGALRWRLCAWAYPLEVLYNPIVCALPALALMESWGAVIFLAAVILKIALEIATATALRRTPIRLRYLPLIPIKDLLFFGIWWHALMEKKVTWRKINYRMTRGSRLIRIDPPVDPKRSAVPSAQTVCRWMPGPE